MLTQKRRVQSRHRPYQRANLLSARRILNTAHHGLPHPGKADKHLLDFQGIHLPPGHINEIRFPSGNSKSIQFSNQKIRGLETACDIPHPDPDGGGANQDFPPPGVIRNLDAHPLQWLADKARPFDHLQRGIVTDPPAFGGSVEGMDFLAELLLEFPGEQRIQGSPGDNAQAQGIRERIGGKQPPEHGGNGWKHARTGQSQPTLDRPRQGIGSRHQPDPAAEQRRDEVAETIGMRKGNDPEIQIIRTDIHRLADLIAVRYKLLRGEGDSPGLRRCSGGDFVDAALSRDGTLVRLALLKTQHPPLFNHAERYSQLRLDFSPCFPKKTGIKQGHSATRAQTRQNQSRERGMIAGLQRHAPLTLREADLKPLGFIFNIVPGPETLAGRRKNRISAPGGKNLRPSFENQIRHFFVAIRDNHDILNDFSRMKPDIHPNYRETVILCACGAAYRTRSTRENIKIGICAACHPFFTGEQKFVDTAGRVDKFKRRYGTVRAPRLVKKA